MYTGKTEGVDTLEQPIMYLFYFIDLLSKFNILVRQEDTSISFIILKDNVSDMSVPR